MNTDVRGKENVNYVLFVSLLCHWRVWTWQCVHLFTRCIVGLLMKAPIIFMFAVSPRFCRSDISADGLRLYGYSQVIFVCLASGQQWVYSCSLNSVVLPWLKLEAPWWRKKQIFPLDSPQSETGMIIYKCHSLSYYDASYFSFCYTWVMRPSGRLINIQVFLRNEFISKSLFPPSPSSIHLLFRCC